MDQISTQVDDDVFSQIPAISSFETDEERETRYAEEMKLAAIEEGSKDPVYLDALFRVMTAFKYHLRDHRVSTSKDVHIQCSTLRPGEWIIVMCFPVAFNPPTSEALNNYHANKDDAFQFEVLEKGLTHTLVVRVKSASQDAR